MSNSRRTGRFTPTLLAALACAGLAAGANLSAQEQAQSAREAAPMDLAGYWVSVVTEDWRWRMVVPPRGDYASVPLNEEGRRVADSWNPEQDAGNCLAYGAAGLMRMPMRFRVEWDDDATLRIETDAGAQTRLLHFAASDPGGSAPTLQGHSVAEWDGDALRVVTTGLAPGYLRTNGVPYSENTVLTEFFNRHSAFGDEWLTILTEVDDPQYLTEEFVTSTSFKRLEDGSSWRPEPCEPA